MIPKIRWYQQVEWFKLIIFLMTVGVFIFVIKTSVMIADEYDECKTVAVVGGCTRHDCRVGFTDDTNGTVRGPALQGDYVCKHNFRDFWEHNDS